MPRPDLEKINFNRPAETPAGKRVVVRKGAGFSKTVAEKPSKTKTVGIDPGYSTNETIGDQLDQLESFPSVNLKPLWEGEIICPTAHANRPRRLMIREYELYFKTFILPDNLFPVARRLVYADIVNLA